MTDEEKMAFIVHSELDMRKYLRSLRWEEKVASIERMNAAGKMAREGMRKAREAEALSSESVSSEACDVERLG